VYLTGWLVDWTGNYDSAFFMTAGIALLGAVS
jgi:hypothetical protein